MKGLGFVVIVMFVLVFILSWAISTAIVAVGLNGLGPYDFSFSTLAGFGLILAAARSSVQTSYTSRS